MVVGGWAGRDPEVPGSPGSVKRSLIVVFPWMFGAQESLLPSSPDGWKVQAELLKRRGTKALSGIELKNAVASGRASLSDKAGSWFAEPLASMKGTTR